MMIAEMTTEMDEVFLKDLTPEVVWLLEDISFISVSFQKEKFLALVGAKKSSKGGI